MALGELVADTVAEFEPLAKERGKHLDTSVDQEISYRGDEALLHRLVGILMDNAIKYCDQGGEITVNLHRGRRIVLTVENTYAAVGELELNRLFDRFYRADKARKFTGGYGVGLSMAKAIPKRSAAGISSNRRKANKQRREKIAHAKWVMFLAKKSSINLPYLIRGKQIENPDRFQKSCRGFLIFQKQ